MIQPFRERSCAVSRRSRWDLVQRARDQHFVQSAEIGAPSLISIVRADAPPNH
jgi:hypothetical protein